MLGRWAFVVRLVPKLSRGSISVDVVATFCLNKIEFTLKFICLSSRQANAIASHNMAIEQLHKFTIPV